MRVLFLSIFIGLLTLTPSNLVLAQEVSSDEGIYVGGPEAPIVNFSGNLSLDTWHQSKDLSFRWDLPDDITAVATDVSTSSNKEPQTAHRPPIDEFTVDKSTLTEGINYLTVQFRNEEKWGEFVAVPIQIDNTAPINFSMDISRGTEDTESVLYFTAEDELSGISHYAVSVNGRQSKVISQEDSRFGYVLNSDALAPYEIQVAAYDKAGNSTSADIMVVPTEIPPSGQVGMIENGAASLLVGLLASLVLLMLGYLIFERQRYARHLGKLEKETNDIHTQLLRIFSALREEIHDQVQSITKKKRLSKGEREAVEGLKSALSVSESLIEREVKEVKDLLDD